MEFYLLYRFITLEHLNNNLISLFVNVKFTVYLHFVVFPVDSAVQKSVVKCFHVLSGTHTLLYQQIQKILTLRLPISSLFTSQSSIFWKSSEHCQAVLTKTHFAQFCYYMWISSELYLCHMLSVLLILYASIIGLWLNPMQIFAWLLLYLHLSRASFLPIINEHCVHFATQHGAPSAESKVKSTTRSKSQRIVGWIKTSIQYRTLCYLLACSTVVSQSINRNVGSVAGD